MEILSSRVIIHPVDFGASRRFYEQVLGLHVAREWGVGAAYFLGGGLLELSSVGLGHAESDVVATTTLWLQIPSLLGVETALCEQGVVVIKPTETMPWGLKELWIADPDGNELRLVEVPDDHPLRRR